MLSTLALLVVVVPGIFCHTEAAVVYKCDQALIDNIKRLGSSTGILERLTTFGTMGVYKTTSNFFKSDVSCMSIKFYKEAGTTKEFVHIALKEAGKNRDQTPEVYESNGVIYDKEKTFVKYNVYCTDKVFACYACSTSQQADVGPPAGYVAVKEHSGYDKADITAAVNTLKSVGVDATEKHCDNCP